ncbi:MAG: filamentous hemagglutinin N-terminal domain-containing protein, partial [Burkholderiales bacterium]|nr:filamentous hemagglutinin N-terminal domain-containing protein [Burkholderiales bacterium]
MKSHASANRAYRLIWSAASSTWVAVSELTRARGKASRPALALALGMSALLAQAAPSGGQVSAGSATIVGSGTTTTVNQSSQNLSLNWASFNIGAQESVDFKQPNAASIAVNRIADPNGSQIFGHLNANGQVYLINPNGILFGAGSQVNVGGLVASTLDLADAALSTTTRSFSGPGTGAVVNQGTISAAPGGYVALLGNRVLNQGLIQAQMGSVALGAGSAVTLSFGGPGLQMQVDRSTLDNLAQNSQLIQADGGTVLMTAGAKDSVLASVVNNSGVIEARTVENRNGSIVLAGGAAAGRVEVGGTLDVSSASGSGGVATATAQQVNLVDGALVNANGSSGGGTINIGSGWEGGGGIAPATTVTMAAGSTLEASATAAGK